MKTHKPHILVGAGFKRIERYNSARDISVTTPNGDIVNILMTSNGDTHVSLSTLKRKTR